VRRFYNLLNGRPGRIRCAVSLLTKLNRHSADHSHLEGRSEIQLRPGREAKNAGAIRGLAD
jgi:hypothetical protein